MPTTLTNGIQLPDKGSVDWYSSMQSNYNLIDTHLGDTDVHVTAEDKANWNSKQGSLSQDQLDAIAQVATNTDDIATLQSDKADASHTHSSSDITDIDDYATKDYVDNSISGLVDNAPDALNTLNELSAALNDDSNFASTVTTALAAKANSADLATVATSGSYDDLDDKPTIPTNTSDLTNDSDFVVSSNLATVATSGDYDDLDNKPTINDSTITIQKNGSTVDTFTTNGSDKTIDITVPTKTSDLTNDSSFVDTSNAAVSSGITSAKVTDYDTHIADTDIHVTTADKDRWNNNTYVFRYSSTALVDSSTNSNALLDNTDNLKVGDKVIDSSGVLFSITAIDTQNSTFTIGTALIDLAQDSDVVHKSGNETVGGAKTFTDVITNNITNKANAWITLKNSSYDPKTNGQSNANSGSFSIGFNTLTDDSFAWISAYGLPEYSMLRLTTTYFTDSENSITDSIEYKIYQNGDRSLRPRYNSNCTLGETNRRWSKIYGTEYYYGSSNVEFSQKFVTTDTNQTISGNKTFSDNLTIYNSDDTVTPKGLIIRNAQWGMGESGGTTVSSINFLDKNSSIPVSVMASKGISGQSFLRFSVRTKDSQNNTYSEEIYYDIDTLGNVEFRPWHDNAISLGTPLYKWKDVYATNYYYGNDKVEFSTKFVTTDTAQTISGNKTFSSNVNVYNSDSATDTANIVLKNSKAERGSTTNIGEQNIFFLDKDNAQIGDIKCEVDANGVSTLTLNCTNSSNSSSGIRLRRTSVGTFLQPTYNNGCNLGTSGYRWYDVQTRAVNSLEPSSLSLPSDRSARIDISSYITNLGNGDNNQYIVPANGYIWLHFTSINSALCYSQTSGGLTNYAQTFVRYSGDGQLYAFFPVRKNDYFIVQIYTSSTAVVQSAYFIPCQGNV